MAMIRPETEMKDSGIAWIGDIPSNWETIPLKKIVVDRAGGAWGNEPYENNSTICMRIADFDFDRGVFQDKSETELTKRSYKECQIDKLLLQTNDICIEKSGGGEKTPVGRAVLFDKPYDALFANFMDRIRVDNAVSFPKYVEYYLRAMYFLSVTTLYIKQTTGIQNLNVTSLLEKEVITLPSLSEQQAIADYLDETCSKIDEIIAEAKASIDEYKELKQSVIFEAVTKGLDKNVEMKDSGVEWMGVIPKHWSTPKLKYFTNISSGGTPDRNHYEYWNGNVNWIKTGELQNNELYDSEEKISELGVANSSAKLFKENTILIAMYGQGKTRGMTALLKVPCTTNQACAGIVMKSNSPYEIYYLWLTLQASYRALREKAVGTGQPNLSIGLLKDFYIPLPTLQEQKEVINFLKKVMPKYDSLITEKESLIHDLEAYKKSLIYEVVTGKRKVV